MRKKSLLFASIAVTAALFVSACSSSTASIIDTPPLSVADKLSAIHELVMEMDNNGMKSVHTMLPDLKVVRTITLSDPRNVAAMGSETWMYSERDDLTVIVCNEMNTPAHVFKGKTLSQSQIDTVKAEMAEMMNGDMDMGMMDHGAM